MFDIGFTELLFCFVIALIVLGPQKLSQLAHTLGRWTGQARGYLRNLTAELDREAKLGELKKQLDEANRMVRAHSQDLSEAVNKDIADAGKDLPPKL